jgi:hypothetical protein
MKKKLPKLETDEAAEAFVNEADLSQYDLSGMKHISFEFSSMVDSGHRDAKKETD